ncbi:hypothetical protein phiRKBJ001_19 [Streptomyces phage phiRKBJ001]|nr:hypothetical protein phiRKBJ001_19 [Streptomyces phage phiRKBJ001]
MADIEKPAKAEKPIGPTEARGRAEAAARAGKWDESQAWSLLGLLALERRVHGGGRRGH